MLALVRAGEVYQHLIGPLFYSTAAVRLLRENRDACTHAKEAAAVSCQAPNLFDATAFVASAPPDIIRSSNTGS
jgi:hypothetical protein